MVVSCEVSRAATGATAPRSLPSGATPVPSALLSAPSLTMTPQPSDCASWAALIDSVIEPIWLTCRHQRRASVAIVHALRSNPLHALRSFPFRENERHV